MGERHSGGGLPGRRRAHPGGTVSPSAHAGTPGPADPAGRPDGAAGRQGAPEHRHRAHRGLPGLTRSPALPDSAEFARFEADFGAVLRADGAVSGAEPEGERRALAAFRAARESGAHGARTRTRDDWRPKAARRTRFSLKGTLSVALASLALGGVAVAAIGSAGSGTADGRDTSRSAHPSVRANPRAPGTTPGADGASPSAPGARPGHPDTAKDTLAHCRTYVRAGDRGNALEATAWQRLAAAAGGPEQVASYCADRIARAARQAGSPGRNAGASPGANANKGNNSGNSDRNGNAGNRENNGKNGDSPTADSGSGAKK
ncbi:hypothetical protein ACFV2Z_01510 [Streptomyces sp. NPDC059688]|uniref:hypothetical protein n=1 Tax=Streptomyces sp. NPDC059688 TaxID=3346906 RepID=UPI0036BC18F5